MLLSLGALLVTGCITAKRHRTRQAPAVVVNDESGAGKPEPQGLIPLAVDAVKPTQDVVFLIEGYEVFVPLACYVSAKSELAGGADCLDLVKLPATLGRARAGTTADISRSSLDICQGDGSEHAVFVAAPRPAQVPVPEPASETDASRPDYLVWPATARVAVAYAPAPAEPAQGQGDIEMPSAEHARLEDAVKGWAPEAKGTLIVDQRVEVDIDSDGKTEVFYSAYIPASVDSDGDGESEIDESEHQWAGFVLSPGTTPDALVPLVESKLERVHIIGILDIDGDGARELWYEIHYYEGSYQFVGRLHGGTLQAIGSYGCGA